MKKNILNSLLFGIPFGVAVIILLKIISDLKIISVTGFIIFGICVLSGLVWNAIMNALRNKLEHLGGKQ